MKIGLPGVMNAIEVKQLATAALKAEGKDTWDFALGTANVRRTYVDVGIVIAAAAKAGIVLEYATGADVMRELGGTLTELDRSFREDCDRIR